MIDKLMNMTILINEDTYFFYWGWANEEDYEGFIPLKDLNSKDLDYRLRISQILKDSQRRRKNLVIYSQDGIVLAYGRKFFTKNKTVVEDFLYKGDT